MRVSADSQRQRRSQPTATTCSGRPIGWPTSSAACGLPPRSIPTAGHPLVYAESPAVPGAPTALVYGHYDVQPADPLEKWTTPPFEPVRRDGNVYARGATDDKGQMLTHIKSAEAWITVEGRLPLNLKFLIEGEEEVGSEAAGAVHRRSTPSGWPAIAWSSATAASSRPALPAITYGLRGHRLLRDSRVTGPNRDLHSGTFRRLGDQSGQRPGAKSWPA